MFEKKRWWFGFGLGLMVALSPLAVFGVSMLRNGSENVSAMPLVLFTLGALVSSWGSWYIGFGKGRQDWGQSWYDTSRSYPHIPYDVPPYPFLGGLMSGYSVITVLAIVSLVVWAWSQ